MPEKCRCFKLFPSYGRQGEERYVLNTMNNPTLYNEYFYMIISAGEIELIWDSVLEKEIEDNEAARITRFTLLTDQAGLIGFLRTLFNHGIPLISVRIINPKEHESDT